MLKPYHKAELQFDIVSEIGQEGKNSRTYIAFDHQLSARIVAKELNKSKINSPAEFFAESQALYASSHPNVVQIHYACYDDNNIYIAMPFYRNGSVKSVMGKRFLTVREIISISANTLAGLQNIHSKNLIHFDIKPDNILLSDRNEGLVADFGQAKQMNFSGIAAQDRLYGKMLPPEALSSDHFGRTFDIYQVGLTMYRMCNGDAEFYKQFAKYGTAAAFDRKSFLYDLRNGKFPDRSIFPPHIPSTLRNAVRKCLQVDPTRRFQSAIEVTNAIAGIDGACLDWSYAQAADKRIWTKVTDDSEYELIVNSDGSSACYKSVNGGTRRRVSAGTKPSMTDRELKAFFAEY